METVPAQIVKYLDISAILLFMASKYLFAFFLVLITLFSVNGYAQACFDPDSEETIELTHPTDNSSYFVAAPKDFSFKTALNGVTTYQLGTTILVFKTSSYTTANVSDTKTFARIVLSEYNNTDTYTKIVDLTDTTVGTYKAHYLEYRDPDLSETGRATVIIGDRAESRTKVYVVILRSKNVKFEDDKVDYLKMLSTFSLDPLDECAAAPEPPPAEPPPAEPPPVNNNSDDTPTPPNNPDDSTNPDDSSLQNPPSTPQPPADNEFKIFGFDGVLVIGAVVVLLLILGIGFVVLAVIAIAIYFFFIKKR